MDKRDEILLKFINKCGGGEFVRGIASGRNPCDDQVIVAAAKAAVCDLDGIRNHRIPERN